MSRAADWINPVLAREIVERMRGLRAMVMLTAYLGVLGLVLVVVYRSEAPAADDLLGGSLIGLASAGQSIFEWTLLFAMLLVLFLVPGFTAGSVAGERERQTLVPMQVSLLSPLSIVLGKVWASVAFTLLLLVATLPLLTVAYLIGGITLVDILKGTGMVMFTAVGVGALSVACSTFMRRVQTATVLSYGVVLVLGVGTVMAYAVAAQISPGDGFEQPDPPRIILAPNPVVALADAAGDGRRAFGDEFYFDEGDGPLTSIEIAVNPGEFDSFEFAAVPAVPAIIDGLEGDVAVSAAEAPGRRGGFGPPLWAQHMLIIGAGAALSVGLSSRRLRTPSKTPR